MFMATLFDPFQPEGLLILLTLLLQVSVLAVCALVVSHRYKQNAAIRYGITFSALLCVGVLTASSLFIQSSGRSIINIPLFSEQWIQNSQYVESFFSSDRIDLGTESSSSATLIPASQTTEFLGSSPTWPDTLASTLGIIPIVQALIVIWLGGALLAVLRLLLSLHNVDKVRRSSRCLERNDLEHVKCIAGRKKVEKYDIQFRESSTITTPLVVGIFKPIVLLPSKFLWKLNHKQLAAILLHELAHIERKDTKANLIQKLITIVFWFHPLVHMLDRQISKAREEICDNNVLEEQSPLEYSEALLHASLATTSVPGKVSYTAGAVGVFSGDWKLENRIQELIDIDREQCTDLQLEDRVGILLGIGIVTVVLSLSQVSVADMSNTMESGVNTSTGQSTELNSISSLIKVNYIPASQRTNFLSDEHLTQTPQTLDTAYSPNDSNSTIPRFAGPEPREPPPTRGSDVLSPRVFSNVTAIQEMLTPSTGEPDLEAAKEMLDELYENRYERMNDFEKSTVLNIYTNYYLMKSDYAGAIGVLEQMLTIESLREDNHQRALRALGQLNLRLENHAQAVGYFNQWRDLSDNVDESVLMDLVNSYVALEDFESAYLVLLELSNSRDERFKLIETSN